MFNAIVSLDVTGVLLIIVGLILVASELSAPSHGAIAFLGFLTAFAGVAALASPALTVAVHAPTLFVVCVLLIGFAVVVSGLATSLRRRKVVTGIEAMLGAAGSVLSWTDTTGHILIQGERWRAAGGRRRIGEKVCVVGIEGLTLLTRSLVEDLSLDHLDKNNGE